jgi:TolB-like protein
MNPVYIGRHREPGHDSKRGTVSQFTSAFSELRKRHLFQIVVVYLGVAWFFVEIVGFLVDNYELSRKVLDTAVMLAALGFPAAMVIGWNHGAKGRQHIARAEVWLLVTLGVMAGIGTYRITTAEELPQSERSDAQLALGPGDAETGSSTTAVATGGPVDLGAQSVAVFPFDNNVADPELNWLGSGLADMLTTNFAQIPSLRVVGRQRLFDLLLEAGRDETDQIPESLATGIAELSGAHSMVRGSVVGSAEDLAIDAQLIDLQTGEVVAAERVRGQDVFDMVDTLSARLASRISGEPQQRMAEAPLTRIATRDPEAARAFYEGLHLQRAGEHEEARVRMERSVELDSTNMLALMALSTDEDHESGEDALRYRTMALREVKRILPNLRTVFAERDMDDEKLVALEHVLETAQVELEEGGSGSVNLDSIFQDLFSSVRVVVPRLKQPRVPPEGGSRPPSRERPPPE